MFPKEDAAPESGGDVAGRMETPGENTKVKSASILQLCAGGTRCSCGEISFWRGMFCRGDPTRPRVPVADAGGKTSGFAGEKVAAFFYWNNGGSIAGRRRWQRTATGRYFSPRSRKFEEYGHRRSECVATESTCRKRACHCRRLPTSRCPWPRWNAKSPRLPSARNERPFPEMHAILSANCAAGGGDSECGANDAGLAPQPARPPPINSANPVAAKRGISQALLVPYSGTWCIPAAALAQKFAWSRGAADGDWTRPAASRI